MNIQPTVTATLQTRTLFESASNHQTLWAAFGVIVACYAVLATVLLTSI